MSAGIPTTVAIGSLVLLLPTWTSGKWICLCRSQILLALREKQLTNLPHQNFKTKSKKLDSPYLKSRQRP